jgi:hypothetical protein
MTYVTAARVSVRASYRTPASREAPTSGFPIFAIVLSIALLAIALAFLPNGQDVALDPGFLLQVTGL